MFGIQTKDIHGKVLFDSTQDRMKVKLDKDPPRIGNLSYTFVSNPSSPARSQGGATTTIPLLTINHNIGYVPASSVFMFVFAQDNAGAFIPVASYYPLGSGSDGIELTGAGTVFQYIDYNCDGNRLAINLQRFDNPSIGAGTPYNDPTGFGLVFKYAIYSNPGA